MSKNTLNHGQTYKHEKPSSGTRKQKCVTLHIGINSLKRETCTVALCSSRLYCICYRYVICDATLLDYSGFGWANRNTLSHASPVAEEQTMVPGSSYP